MEGIIIGIDFGTTNTSVAYMKYNNIYNDYKAECFSLDRKETISSLITYKSKDEFWIGKDAQNHSLEYPRGFIKSLKRQIINDNINVTFPMDIGHLDIMADYLSHIFKRIQPQLPYDTFIQGVAIGIPIGFRDKDKEIYIRALQKSGFYKDYNTATENTIFVSEPIAAVLNYNVSLKDDKRVLVFDFGGGTLDLVIMDLKNIKYKDEIEDHDVIIKKGNLKLGGDDFDRAILENIVLEKYGLLKLKRQLKINSISEIFNVQEGIELMNQIRETKEELSRYDFSKIAFERGKLKMNIDIKRNEYELAIKDYLLDIREIINKSLAESHITSNDIDIVILSGGSSLTPSVQRLLWDIFGKRKVKIDGNAMTSISRGLALRGSDSERDRYNDILEHNYGILMKDEGLNDNTIEAVLTKGSKMDKINNGDFYKEFLLIKNLSRRNTFRIKVYENDEEIGVANIPIDDDMKYSTFKLHFTIDNDSKRLELHIYTEGGKKLDIPIEERFLDLTSSF